MSKKKLIPLIAVLVLLVLAYLVKVVFFRNEFRYAGTIEVTKVDIPARVQSVIAAMPVKEGDVVQNGQNLMTLACEDIKLGFALAQSNFKRGQKLFSSGNISREAFDDIQNKKDDLQLRTTWCNIFSPLKGTIITKYFEVGEMVNPGAKLFTVGDLDEVYAYFYLPHDEIAKLKIGQSVSARLPEMKDKSFSGVIEFINPEAEFTPKNVQTRDERTRLVFGVKIRFKNTEGVLKPGMTLEWNSEG